MQLEALREYGNPVIDREYGVQSVEHRTYRRGDASAEVVVEQAGEASAAYGLFTFYRTENMTPVNGVFVGVQGPEGALAAAGRAFIRVLNPKGSRIPDDELQALLRRASNPATSPDTQIQLPAALPGRGSISGSEKYVVGPEAAKALLPSFRTDLIGFSRGAELQMAAYASGKARMTVLGITYPTPQIARLEFGLMKKLLDVNEDKTAAIYGRRLGSFVFLVLNASSSASASKLLEDIRISNYVSWDKPYPGDKPFTLQMMELILANMFFVFMLMSFAVAGGVLVVLSQRVIRKFFPQIDWGRGGEGSIITLHLDVK